jgi:succinate dehydrogenase/fumarate reductase iron-sulfur protein
MIKAIDSNGHAGHAGHPTGGNGHATGNGHAGQAARQVRVRVLRQDVAGGESYWERFEVPYEPNMNVISVLQKIAAQARTADGRRVAPVTWDCACLEEVCGSCTMLINGRTRMACSALVDKLLAEEGEIELRPMSKFPVVRDLVVDRRRLFRALERVKAWVPVDNSYDHGPGPRISPEQQQDAYPLAECISCGSAWRPARSSPKSNSSERTASRRPTSRPAAGRPSTRASWGPTLSARRCSSTRIPPAG